MAAPPRLTKIAKELLGPNPPEAVLKMAGLVSGFMQETVSALSQGLTVGQNLAQAWVTVEATAGAVPPVQAVPSLRGRVPYGVTVERVEVLNGGAAPSSAVFVYWEPATISSADGTRQPGVSILQVYGLSTGTTARLTLLVKAE